VLESIRYVDLVFPEQTWEQKFLDILKYDAQIFVMGSDWKGKFDMLKNQCEVVYLERTPAISTTLIKDSLSTI
jgi:glycerol-3-phosphate cytidylyltransferase